jgi:hypothetical protein
MILGERHLLKLPRGAHQVEVVAPDGSSRIFDVGPSQEAAELQFGDAKIPGHYRVRVGVLGSFNDEPSLSFAVNLDTRESDLRAIGAEEALTVLKGAGTGGAEVELPSLAQLGGTPFTRPEMLAMMLLLLACLAFVGESALTAERPRHN